MMYTEGLIDKKTLAQIEKRHGVMEGEPLRIVSSIVTEDKEMMVIFANVLLKSKWSKGSEVLGKELLYECGE